MCKNFEPWIGIIWWFKLFFVTILFGICLHCLKDLSQWVLQLTLHFMPIIWSLKNNLPSSKDVTKFLCFYLNCFMVPVPGWATVQKMAWESETKYLSVCCSSPLSLLLVCVNVVFYSCGWDVISHHFWYCDVITLCSLVLFWIASFSKIIPLVYQENCRYFVCCLQKD